MPDTQRGLTYSGTIGDWYREICWLTVGGDARDREKKKNLTDIERGLTDTEREGD